MMTAKLGSDRQRWTGEWWQGGPLPEHEAITESFSMGLLSQQSSYCFHSLVKYILDVQLFWHCSAHYSGVGRHCLSRYRTVWRYTASSGRWRPDQEHAWGGGSILPSPYNTPQRIAEVVSFGKNCRPPGQESGLRFRSDLVWGGPRQPWASRMALTENLAGRLNTHKLAFLDWPGLYVGEPLLQGKKW